LPSQVPAAQSPATDLRERGLPTQDFASFNYIQTLTVITFDSSHIYRKCTNSGKPAGPLEGLHAFIPGLLVVAPTVNKKPAFLKC